MPHKEDPRFSKMVKAILEDILTNEPAGLVTVAVIRGKARELRDLMVGRPRVIKKEGPHAALARSKRKGGPSDDQCWG